MIWTQSVLRPLVVFLILASWVGVARASGVEAVREKSKRYEELSAQYALSAVRISKNPDLSTSYLNVDSKEQFCMVLIDLLGIDPGTSFQSVQGIPDSDSDDPVEQVLYSASLRSYIDSANILLQEDDFSLKYEWNLNCAGVFGADKYFKISDSPPWSVSISPDGTTLYVVGDIRRGLYDAIAKRLAIHARIKRVELASLGGYISDGIKIGRLLRKRKITTVVGSNCYSSCALVFLGGAERIVPAPYWNLGFHRASSRGIPLWDGDGVYDEIKDYVDDMIGAGGALVQRSFVPVGLDFYRPSRSELCSSNIATSVEDVCKAALQKN